MSNVQWQPEPMPIPAREMFTPQGELRSPEGEEQNHPVAVRVNRGGEITEVTNAGTRVYAGDVPDRGVRIELDFDTEQGINWTLALHFQKGITRAEVLKRSYDSAYPWPSVIWRN